MSCLQSGLSSYAYDAETRTVREPNDKLWHGTESRGVENESVDFVRVQHSKAASL